MKRGLKKSMDGLCYKIERIYMTEVPHIAVRQDVWEKKCLCHMSVVQR